MGSNPVIFPAEFDALLRVLGAEDLPSARNTLFAERAYPGYADLAPRPPVAYPPNDVPDFKPRGPRAPLLEFSEQELTEVRG